MGLDLDNFVPDLEGASHADVERVCLDAMRECLLAGSEVLRDDHLVHALARQHRRAEILEGVQREARAREEIGR